MSDRLSVDRTVVVRLPVLGHGHLKPPATRIIARRRRQGRSSAGLEAAANGGQVVAQVRPSDVELQLGRTVLSGEDSVLVQDLRR